MGLSDLSQDGLELLVRRTEGWVAGLQLTALSLRNRNEPNRLLEELSAAPPRFVVDYLVEDVLDRQPGDVRSFLEYTSVLDRLCGPVCDAVTRTSGGQAMLERLERANLFISPLDAERFWYRYHGLFAEALLQRVRRVNPALIPELHTRAAAWFTSMKRPRDAVEHALLAGDSRLAATQIRELHQQLFLEGEHATLQRWLDQLSESVLDEQPSLRVAQA
jgi:LuxR family maltose regulon positive regulatory protein